VPLPYTVVDAGGLSYVEHAGKRALVGARGPTAAPAANTGLAAEAPAPGSPAGGDAAQARPLGRLSAFHGQMGMYVRALTYMLSHGADGMRQASEDAVLNANYVRSSLADLMSAPFGAQLCMHEALFDDAWLDGTGITTLDFAKAMIDEGYHPMTVYFPLVVHGAMLIEPTESESKASLDQFIASMRGLAGAAKGGDAARFRDAPRYAPRRRLDETKAAREPRLRWTPPQVRKEAAE
jgi:glycine dehydrogenase subunit 2